MLRKTTLASFLLAAFPAIAQDIAIVGGTLIDGNGGAPVADAVIVVAGRRIAALGPRTTTPIPPGAKIIDATNRYIVPGFIDTNVHLSLYGGARDRYETIAKYYPRESEIVLEAAQIDLRYGVTTVRDSYGMLLPLIDVRDRIARGAALGARVLAAGNIVGWGGPYSVSFLRMSRQSANFAAFPVLTQDSQGPQEVTWAHPRQLVKSSCIRPLTGRATPDFSLSVSPASQTVQNGSTVRYTVTINLSNGFNNSVTLSLSGGPAGATVSFSPNPTTNTSTLTIVTPS